MAFFPDIFASWVIFTINYSVFGTGQVLHRNPWRDWPVTVCFTATIATGSIFMICIDSSCCLFTATAAHNSSSFAASMTGHYDSWTSSTACLAKASIILAHTDRYPSQTRYFKPCLSPPAWPHHCPISEVETSAWWCRDGNLCAGNMDSRQAIAFWGCNSRQDIWSLLNR